MSTSDHYEVGLKRKKKSTTRANRHGVKQALKDPDADALPQRKEVWQLGPSGELYRLQDDIKLKQQRRAQLEQAPRKNAEARERRRQRRGGGSG